MWQIPLFDLNYDKNESNAVLDVLQSKWLSSGVKTNEFEKDFSDYLDNKSGKKVYSVAVSSCTAALHLALIANNIKNGDEVIVSGLTFVAALNVICLCGATPVPADSKSLADWNVAPEDIRKKITPKTKAVIIVHFAGYPCDMDEIKAICDEYKLILIEDSAHAIGSEYKGHKTGTIGDIGCFSFFSNKNLSTGEGGMIVTKSAELSEKFRLLRSHGMTSMTIDRHNQKAISYDVLMPGFNYRIDEIRSALGIEQLKKLDEANAKRKLLFQKYCFELEGLDVVIPFAFDNSSKSSCYHIFPILIPENTDRENITQYLKDKGIQTSRHYPAFREFSHYHELIKEELSVAEEISKRVLTLPLYPSMTFEQVDYICTKMTEGLK